MEKSSADIRFDPGLKRFIGTTENVERLAFDLDILNLKDSVTVDIDSQKVGKIPLTHEQRQIWLENKSGKWELSSEPLSTMKNSHRYGTFKEIFRNLFVFVYGTTGSKGENKWAFDKARYDAEKFWYQGNGSVDIFSDNDFDPARYHDNNIILYGNKNTNGAWIKLLADSPVQVENGLIKIGKHKFSGNDLSCIFVRPKTGSISASVAAISGSGIVGMRLNNRLPYLNPGIGLPDCTVLSPEVLTKGEEGVILTGFWGLDWSVENGDIIYRKK